MGQERLEGGRSIAWGAGIGRVIWAWIKYHYWYRMCRSMGTATSVGKYVSKGDIKRADYGLSVVGGTQLRNVKWYDDSPSVIGRTQRDMRYVEVVSKR